MWYEYVYCIYDGNCKDNDFIRTGKGRICKDCLIEFIRKECVFNLGIQDIDPSSLKGINNIKCEKCNNLYLKKD